VPGDGLYKNSFKEKNKFQTASCDAFPLMQPLSDPSNLDLPRPPSFKAIALEEGLQLQPKPSKSSRRITPQPSHKPRLEANLEEFKPKYYMRKELFKALPSRRQRESTSKGERQSQNSAAQSSRHLQGNSYFGSKQLNAGHSQNNSCRMPNKASPSITGFINASTLR
jgi:hypothetical protein